MAPTLLPGDQLLVRRLRRPPRVGEVVLAADPRDSSRELVKRVAAVDPGGVTLLGDDRAQSTDAREFGAVPVESVRWSAIVRYWPPHRIGRLARPPASDRP